MGDPPSSNGKLNALPGDCVSAILSMTSPLDACRASVVSSAFKSSAESDLVWERFLPRDYKQLISRVFDPVVSSVGMTKKELFFHLCSSVLLDGGNKILALERASGLKSYTISPRELYITWSDVPTYWCWKSIPVPRSRFREVAELITTSWLEIRAEIHLNTLSPNTTYGAYLIYRATERSYGLDTMPMEASVKVSGRRAAVSRTAVRLRQHGEAAAAALMEEELWCSHRSEMLTSGLGECGGELSAEEEGPWSPKLRDEEDGFWMEVALGKFSVEEEEDHDETGSGDPRRTVSMSITEVKGHHLKGGLIIGGIQVRPDQRGGSSLDSFSS